MDGQERLRRSQGPRQDARLSTAARRALVAAALAATVSTAPAAAATWTPDVAAARAYAAPRPGTASFAVRAHGRLYGHRTQRGVPAVSTVKAMLLVAYLKRAKDRPLVAEDRRLLAPMVRRSDDDAANRVFVAVGTRGLARLGVPGFRAHPTIWGNSTVTARGMSRFMLTIDRRMPPRHRAYGMSLLRTIVPRQRWGIGRVRLPRGWHLYFKSGWGSGSGAADHQVALLTDGERRISVAVMTSGNGSHAAGKATLRGIARRLLRGLPPARG